MHCILFNCFMHVFDFYTLSLCSLRVELPYGWFSVHSHHRSLRCEIKLSYWAQPLLNFFLFAMLSFVPLDFSQSFQLTQSTCTCPHGHTHTHTVKIYHSLMMMAHTHTHTHCKNISLTNDYGTHTHTHTQTHTRTLLICLYSG